MATFRPPFGRHRCRRFARLAAALAIILAGWGLGPGLAQPVTYFRIGTSASDTAFFAVGGLLASAISKPPGSRPCESGGSCGVPGLVAVAVSTEGSQANIEAVAAGRLESGLAQADVAYWAYKGTGLYVGRERVKGISAIASLYPETVHVVVRKSAKIRSVKDLVGKRVSLGPDRTGTNSAARAILQAYGVSTRSLRLMSETAGRASELMRKGQLDAYFTVAGDPVAGVADLAEGTEIDILPLAGKPADELVAKQPFFSATIIPAGTYTNVAEVKTLSVRTLWLVGNAVDDNLVYGITRALWHDSMRRLLDSRPADGQKIRLKTALDGLVVPLHPGAARFYREVGMLK
ncbi:MAG: TAXI family TRAP transporter solute-binding subunit [Alphaproteobacteria bacterium]